MERKECNTPLPLRNMQVTDTFWKKEMELVRKEAIPYQWEALNDRVEGAAPSFCIRNFKVAGKLNRKRREMGASFEEPKYTFRGFESLPKEPGHLEDKFYGFVFQDSDFYKWIEAVGYSLTQHPDSALEEMADRAVELVCNAQQEDGYLDTYYIINGRDKSFTNLRDNHELYCFGHLVEGAVAYWQATGKKRLLDAVRKFADYIDGYFGPEKGKCKGYPGHEVAEMALARLYEATGEERYLALARFFIEERGRQPYYFEQEDRGAQEEKKGKEEDAWGRNQYCQAHLPVREQEEAVGHAVRAVYLYSGMAEVARLTGDEGLYAACRKLWDSIVNEKMYLTAGIGGTHIGEAFSFPYDLPDDTAYAETCASIGLVFFARRMLGISPEAEYADVMERALYNGILSGMALDGKSFFYVNPLSVNPVACRRDERKSHVKAVRQKWFGCACCPPNLSRLVSSVGAYAFSEREDTLFVHLYMSAKLSKEIGGKRVQIEIVSGFPWEGKVQIHVKAQDTGLTLALRLPGWCREYQIAGCLPKEREERKGYLYVKKDWGEADTLELTFPMEVCLIAANGAVRETVGKAALMRGPVVYCLEGADNGEELHLLSIDTDAKPQVWDGEICGLAAKRIAMPGYRQQERESGLYHVWKKPEKEKTMLQYIPYFMWANRGENEMQVWTRTE